MSTASGSSLIDEDGPPWASRQGWVSVPGICSGELSPTGTHGSSLATLSPPTGISPRSEKLTSFKHPHCMRVIDVSCCPQIAKGRSVPGQSQAPRGRGWGQALQDRGEVRGLGALHPGSSPACVWGQMRACRSRGHCDWGKPLVRGESLRTVHPFGQCIGPGARHRSGHDPRASSLVQGGTAVGSRNRGQ